MRDTELHVVQEYPLGQYAVPRKMELPVVREYPLGQYAVPWSSAEHPARRERPCR